MADTENTSDAGTNASGGSVTKPQGFCGAETQISTHTCNSLHPAVDFDGLGNAGVAWHDNRSGNFEIMFKALQAAISQEEATLGVNGVVDPKSGRVIDISCSGISGFSGFQSCEQAESAASGAASGSSQQASALIRGQNGRLDISVTSRTAVLTATGVDLTTKQGVGPGSKVTIQNGKNAGLEFLISSIAAPTVAELVYFDGPVSDTEFGYSVYSSTRGGTMGCEARLTCNTSVSLYPDVAGDSNGRFHVVYQDNEAGKFHLYYTQVYPKSIGPGAGCSGRTGSGGAFGQVSADAPGATLPTMGQKNITLSDGSILRPDGIIIYPGTPWPPTAGQATMQPGWKDTDGTVHVGFPPPPDPQVVALNPEAPTAFQATGEVNRFFSVGNRLLPRGEPYGSGSSRHGNHLLYRDFYPGGGAWTGLSDASDRPAWDVQIKAASSSIIPSPEYVVPSGNPVASEGDFGQHFEFTNIAFLAQSPPDFGVAVQLVALPLIPACVPNKPSSTPRPREGDLVDAPKQPAPPTFIDPVDLSGLFTSPLVRIDENSPARFTIEGDSTGTVFTNMLVETGSGQLERLVFRRDEARPELRFVLGRYRCGDGPCAVKVSDASVTVEEPGAQYRMKLQVWAGPDYRPDQTVLQSAQAASTLLLEKEFQFNPGDSMSAFEFVRGELILPPGRMIFFVPIAIDKGTEFMTRAIGGGNSVWTTSGGGAFDNFSSPFTLPPYGGLNAPVYYEGILTTPATVNTGTTTPTTPTATSGPYVLQVGGRQGGTVINPRAEIGYTASTGFLPRQGYAQSFKLPKDATLTSFQFSVAVENSLNPGWDPTLINQNYLQLDIVGVKTASNLLGFEPDENLNYYSTQIPASDLPPMGSAGVTDSFGNFPYESYFVTVTPPTAVSLSAGQYVLLIRAKGPNNNGLTLGPVSYRLPVAYAKNPGDGDPFDQGLLAMTWAPWLCIFPLNIYLDGQFSEYSGCWTLSVVGAPASAGRGILGSDPAMTRAEMSGTPFRIVSIGKPETTLAQVLASRMVIEELDVPLYPFGGQFTILLDGIQYWASWMAPLTDCPPPPPPKNPIVPVVGGDNGGDNGGTPGEYASTPPVRLTVGPGDDEHPRAGKDELDNLWVVWHSTRGGNEEIYVARSFGQCSVWDSSAFGGQDLRLTNFSANGGRAMFPNVAVDQYGEAHVVFQGIAPEDGRWEVYYTRSTGGKTAFLDPIRLTTSPGDAMMPDVHVDRSGKVVVVWHDNRFGNFEIMSAAYQDGVWTSSGQGGTDTRITQAPFDSLFPRISGDNADNLRVVWHDRRSGDDAATIFMASYVASAAQWDSSANGGFDRKISNGPKNSLHADVDVDRANGVVVVWHDDRLSLQNPDQHEEVFGLYCPRFDHPQPHFPPLTPNIEARLDVKFDIVDLVDLRPISYTNVPEVGLRVSAPGATFLRAANEDGNFSDWTQFKPTIDLNTTIIPWRLSCKSGQKDVCVQVQDSQLVGFPICKTVTLTSVAPGFSIEFFGDEGLTQRLPNFKQWPAAKAGDVFVKITAQDPMLEPPTFDVVNRGLNIIMNQSTEAVSGFSGMVATTSPGLGSFLGTTTNTSGFSAYGSKVFKARFTVRDDDGIFHVDGLARLIPHGKDVCGNVF